MAPTVLHSACASAALSAVSAGTCGYTNALIGSAWMAGSRCWAGIIPTPDDWPGQIGRFVALLPGRGLLAG
jgi:hypothetical protein